MSATSTFNSRQGDRPKDSQSTPPTSQYNSRKQPKENQTDKMWPQATPSFSKVDPLTERLNQIRKKYEGKPTNFDRLGVTPLKEARQQSEISLISHRQLEEKPKKKQDESLKESSFEVVGIAPPNLHTKINLTDLRKYEGKSQQYRKHEGEAIKFGNVESHYTKTEYQMPDNNFSRYVPTYEKKSPIQDKNFEKSQDRHVTPKKQEKPWRLAHSPSIPTNYSASKHIGSLTARTAKSPITTSQGDEKVQSIAALRARIQQNVSQHAKSVSNLIDQSEARSKKYEQITKDNLPSFARNLPSSKKQPDGTSNRIRQLDDEIEKIRKRIGETDGKYVSKYSDDKKKYNLDLQAIRHKNKDTQVDHRKRQIVSKQTNETKPRDTLKYDASRQILQKQLREVSARDYTKNLTSRQYLKDNPVANRDVRHIELNKRQHEHDYPKAQALNFKVMPISCQTEESQYEPAVQSGGLIDCFKRQVTLDEELRNAKIWLENIDCQNKWQKIKDQFQRIGERIPQDNLEKVLSNSLEEHNPFYTPKMDGESIQTVVKKYVDAERYWASNILRKFTHQHLKAQNFTEEKLDLERKGHLTVQDFVRFLNIETGTFYRNRDLSLLFKRLTQKDKILFKQLLTQLCR